MSRSHKDVPSKKKRVPAPKPDLGELVGAISVVVRRVGFEGTFRVSWSGPSGRTVRIELADGFDGEHPPRISDCSRFHRLVGPVLARLANMPRDWRLEVTS